MNKSKLKSYAPAARRDFIKAVTERAHYFGVDAKKIETASVQGDVAIIAGRAFPKKVVAQRDKLVQLVQRDGFELAMRKVAYTWFNRFMALRFMELHGYLDHGFRVLSNPSGSAIPEILEQAAHVELPGLNHDKVVELKLDGTRDAELYRLLLVAQCNALHGAMPFLFERIDDETELLLPDNLLHSDSLIRKLVSEIDEEDWQHIEIIGWLYQFYISEKKDEVIGKVVKSEDIPAATQLFTPNWIVKYMVQNSLGAQWLATYPDSPLKGQMEYYIEPAEQTDEVKAQLAAITPSTLDPEKLTLIDPACGSGHILVEAYDLFKAIYSERGYRQRDVAKLILEKNLFGLDIDGRAAQMTGFALMMKGRADDRRLFERGVKLNVMALADSTDFDVEGLAKGLVLSDYGLKAGDLTELRRLFESATTFGSLIQVPEGLAAKLPALKQLNEVTPQDLFVSDSLNSLGPLVRQAALLAAQYDAVVANPPYMGSGGMNALVKDFTKEYFPDSKSDLFACFIERGYTLARGAGNAAMVTMQSWMFLSGFQMMRERLLRGKIIRTMAHLGARAFGSISGEVVQTTAFVLQNRSLQGYKPAFFRLLEGNEEEKKAALAAGYNRFDAIAQEEFKQVPGTPVAYWASAAIHRSYSQGRLLKEVAVPRQGLATMDNAKFTREWHEVTRRSIGFEGYVNVCTWFPYNKGGSYRRWYGNAGIVVNWRNQGSEIKQLSIERYGTASKRVVNEDSYFLPSVTWSKIGSSIPSFRYQPPGAIFDVAGMSMFPGDDSSRFSLLLFLNSPVAAQILSILSPTLNFEAGQIGILPILPLGKNPDLVCRALIEFARQDWDYYERSWDFQSLPILTASSQPTPTLESSYTAWITKNKGTVAEMQRLEEENNRLFIDAYGLADELSPDVPIDQITLTVNPAYRYGGNLTEEEQWTRFRQDTMAELVSYAIGCMMGRYSLDEPGLIYAHAGNVGFDPTRYNTFPADADGIVPVTDELWFEDDAAKRVREFLLAVWGPGTLEENMAWLAENLGKKAGETPEEAIRRYLSASFFKDHLQTYKKRPIYWLFSSGKEKAFECLVYLHRYNESTLSRMRNEYVIPLQGKFAGMIEHLDNEVKKAPSASAQKKLQKELDSFRKKQTELAKFDEELKHRADQRISIDLDDGVKVNYGKFGTLLAEVKAVTGDKD